MVREGSRIAQRSAAFGIAAVLVVGAVPAAGLSVGQSESVQAVAAESAAERTDGVGLADGHYTVDVQMRKTNFVDLSMANEAIERTVSLDVEDGAYWVTLDFTWLTYMGKQGYLGNLSYYESGFEVNSRFGTITGTTRSAEVLSTQKDASGADIYDVYNDPSSDQKLFDGPYPDLVRVEIPQEAIEATQYGADAESGIGYAPLQVFVPVMESISAGTGTQDCYLRIDWKTLEGDSLEDPDPGNPDPEDPDPVIDTADLSAVVDEAAGLVQGSKADDAWEALQDAIAAAREVLASPTDQASVDAAVAALEAAVRTFNESPDASNDEQLDFANLPDGTYSVYVEMFKMNARDHSMANDAVNHDMKLEVENGEYYLTFDFRGIAMNDKFGYLGSLSYYDNGYTIANGDVQGTLVPGEVLSVQQNDDGTPIADEYSEFNGGEPYPNQVRIKYVEDAINDLDGYVPLQVFVPVMESIADTMGTQDVLAKVDRSSVKRATDDEFVDNENDPSTLPTATSNVTGGRSTINGSAASGKRSTLAQTGDAALPAAVAAVGSVAGATALLAAVARRRMGEE